MDILLLSWSYIYFDFIYVLLEGIDTLFGKNLELLRVS